MRKGRGVVLIAAAVAAVLSGFLRAANAGGVQVHLPSRGVIAFNCESCPSFPPTRTVRWNGGRLRIRGDAGAEVRWSPDGRWFATQSEQGAIVLQSTADASVTRRLTNPRRINGVLHSDEQPAWFPSGKRLVFVRDGALWTVGSDGRGTKRLTAPPAPVKAGGGDPDVSHDGRSIAFDDTDSHLWVTGQRGLTVWRLGPAGLNAFDPRWSPDGTRVAYLNLGQALTVLDLRTNTIHDLSAWTPLSTTDGYYGDGYFSWSPDGNWLAASAEHDYDCGDPTGPCTSMQLWIVNAATGAAQFIFQTPEGGSIGGLDWR